MPHNYFKITVSEAYMWNYSFTLPDFIILFTFIVYYFAHPRLPIKLNSSFLLILIVDFLVILSDVLASKTIENAQDFSPLFIRALNVLYFVLFMFRSFTFFMFTEDVLGIRHRWKSKLCIIANIIFAIFELFAVLNFYFDVIFSISPQRVYSRAPFYNVIYFNAFFFLLFSFSCIFHFRKTVSRSFLLAVILFNLSLLTGYIARFAFPKYLIMNLFTLLAIVIIFISFENPAMYLTGKANAFNKKALYAVFSDMDEQSSHFVMGFIVHNYTELREIYSGTQMDKGISLICQYLAKAYPNLLRFYLHDGRFILIGNDNSKAELIKNGISERFTKPWCAGLDVDIFIEPKFVLLDKNISLENPKKISHAIFAALKEAEKLDNADILINNETLETIEQNTQIKRAVEKAVETNSVELFLQPLMDTKDYTLTGAEALARIRDDEGNLIPPVKFIPIAEKNGRINALGEQMFEKACKFIQEHDIKKMGLKWINVNLSPIQFLRPDLNQRFSEILEKYNVPAELIHLEITEESMIDYVLLQKQIKTMQKAGFKFVLDDYGSGYSNVSRLKKCPFINIKLDMELVREYFKDRDMLLPAVVQALKQMNFTITAEGVETLEMSDTMKEIGCDYLSKPLSAAEFAEKYS